MTASPRNKTLTLTKEETQRFFSRCVSLSYVEKCENVIGKTINADLFSVAKHLPSSSVDLMIVDPPYNLTKNFDDDVFYETTGDVYRDFTEKWLKECLPLLKKDASVYVCCDWKSSIIIAPVLEKYLTIRNRITWQREKGRGASANWKNGLEDIWYCTVSDEYTFNLDAVKVRRKVLAPYKDNGVPKDWTENEDGKYRDTCPSNFWDDVTVPYWSMPENTAHPTQKPEKLLAKLILASSKEGDVVFDPFAGSGSTLVTAKKLGRLYFGVEKSEQYCAWCECRLERAEKDKRIQGYENGIFYARGYKESK